MSLSTQSNPVLDSVSHRKQGLNLTWSDGKSSHFHYLWLRDNCPSTLHPDTQERVFDQLSVSVEIHAVELTIDNNQLTIDWSEGEHQSVFEGQWLRKHAYAGDLAPDDQPTAKSWNYTFLGKINAANYLDLLQDDVALLNWMKQLDQDGLSLVKGMPSTEAALDEIAFRIDYQRQTNFGVTFEVK